MIKTLILIVLISEVGAGGYLLIRLPRRRRWLRGLSQLATRWQHRATILIQLIDDLNHIVGIVCIRKQGFHLPDLALAE